MSAETREPDTARSGRDRADLGDPVTGIRAVLFDFGGVLTGSPFEAFAHYEQRNGLPSGLIRSLNARDPHDNAWARLERNEVNLSEFAHLFEAEALSAGHQINAADVLGLLGGELRPTMIEAVRKCRERFIMGLLTNNFLQADNQAGHVTLRPERQRVVDDVLALFDEVIESSRVGVRKPEVRFFEIACERLAIEPAEAVFLDDLGVNLKPARTMGMRTIKVHSSEQAIADLEAVLGISLG
jgi:putative hydrolase of the HAD superfamily